MQPVETHARHVAGALLCVGVAAVHVEDQGTVSSLAGPAWIGWGYRLIEAAAVVVAGALIYAVGAGWVGSQARFVWVLAALVGLGPLAGYVLTRTTGLPGDSGDIGNWAEPTGVASLILEGLLILTAGVSVATARSRTHPSNAPGRQPTTA
jgi:hypothetical protein